MVTEPPESPTIQGNAWNRTKGGREYRKKTVMGAKCEKPTRRTERNWRAVCAERCKHGVRREARCGIPAASRRN